MSNNEALLVIDTQLVAFDGEITPPVQNGPQLLDKVEALIATCRAANLQIIYLQTTARLGQPYAQDVHGWEIHPRLAPQPNDTIVYKVNSDGFDNTKLAHELKKLEVNKLITCGIWSEYCVTRTSLSAIERGLQVTVAADAHGTVAQTPSIAQAVVEEQNGILLQSNANLSTSQEISERLASH